MEKSLKSLAEFFVIGKSLPLLFISLKCYTNLCDVSEKIGVSCSTTVISVSLVFSSVPPG